MSFHEIELYNGPMDGHRLDLPAGDDLPPSVTHYGILYLDSGVTTEEGIPVYVHARKVQHHDREGQI